MLFNLGYEFNNTILLRYKIDIIKIKNDIIIIEIMRS